MWTFLVIHCEKNANFSPLVVKLVLFLAQNKFEIRISKYETISNDPSEICYAFHGAGKNSKSKKR
jgi:hypothetical protein